jgi:hypothetical protein
LLDAAAPAFRVNRVQHLRRRLAAARIVAQVRDHRNQHIDDHGQVRTDEQDPDPVQLPPAAHDVRGTGNLQGNRDKDE